MAATAKADEDYRIISAAVDQAFYRMAYPELEAPGFDPIRHYLERGWREGRDPAPWFSVRGYLRLHADVAALGDEPFAHYLQHGVAEGRMIQSSEHADRYRREGGGHWTFTPRPLAEPPPPRPSRADSAAPFSEAERNILATEFDRQFYLDTNEDLAEADWDPLEHFMVHGWREGRDPAPWFCVSEYLADNPDVASAQVNPFLHYITAGRAERRAPRDTLGFRHKIIASQTSLEARLAEAAARAQHTAPLPAEAFAAIAPQSRTGLKDLHITFSHDDFMANVGGVQLCLQYEGAQIAERGRDHLHLCPATTWPVLRRGEPSALTVVLNGRALGSFTAETVALGLAAARGPGGGGSFAIHNLLGHHVDEVIAILGAAGLEAGYFWLHDFTSLCAGYQLLRNDVEDCGAPPPDSAACGICLYGPGRMPQVAEHERLFRKLKLTVVSPSQSALDFWRASWSYPAAGELVHPHVRLTPRSRVSDRGGTRPLRLAFLGHPAAHKGWPIFAELASRFKEDPRYEFLHLGSRRDPRAAVVFHPVTVSVAEPRAMQAALEQLQVDVAVIWSIFRETFCLAAYEAVGAGCAIVTSPDSGNVASFVDAGGRGRVLADDKALAEALVSGELFELARSVRRPMLYDLEVSGMTADLLGADVAA